ncbi:Gfo/Idh/MocA family oxidoreductase [Streptosporangiaceae bacterium NEAU-GS5]|nr:Gfo/Idh/MocA family oxidoreductase [Streptosporangiaceae bacterium NEAU-GS5]
MIGLGSIAEKAYLPVLASAGVELVLCTRDRRRLDMLAGLYRVRERVTSVNALLGYGIDAAFVHAATEAHGPIVTELIEAGVPVYVDKPLAYRLEDAAALVRLADGRGVPLMVGFNRRYAPGYAALLDRPRDLIVLQKNRSGPLQDPRVTVLDDFIHVVDTLRFLAAGPFEARVRTRTREGLLEHVALTLEGDGWTAFGAMSRTSGVDEETCEVIGGGSKRKVVNLGDVVDYSGGETLRRRPDWTPATHQRGITQACATFLDAIRSGRPLSAADALETHTLCERIVQAAT